MKLEQKTKLYLAFGIVTVVCIAFFAVIGTRSLNNETLSDEIPHAEAKVEIPTDTPLGKAKAENGNAAAWLQIPNTEIDNVVMQPTDNDYYLLHDERGNETPWGCYYADYYANLTSPDSLIQNTVIYGHTENKDNSEGQRFSQLFKFTDLDFATANRNIYLTVGESKLTFEVFAVFYSDTDFYYIDPSPSDQGFDKFLQEIAVRNEYIINGMSVTERDKLLTLSGCSHKYDVNNTGNHRIVIMAKLVPSYVESKARAISQNPSPMRPRE